MGRFARVLAASAAGAAAAMTGAAHAAQPQPWGIGLQAPATDIMGQIAWFENYTVYIIAAITLLVLVLLVVVMVRFNARRHPTPSGTSHNTLLEVAWTIVPVLILVAIAFPSFRLLYNETTIPEPDLTVKATAGQWYWVYEYMDEEYAGIGQVVSNMLGDEARAKVGEASGLTAAELPRQLAVDYPLVVPTGAVVHVLTTSRDVNHAFGVPSFGVKVDAIQGRLNETWFRVEEPGIYYGQCYELCGTRHAFMPIEVRVLPPERFAEWAALAQEDLDAATDRLLAWQREAQERPVAAIDAR